MTRQASWSLRRTFARVSCCTGAERIDAAAKVSPASRLSEDAEDVLTATLALASYWLGATRQYTRQSSSKPPKTEPTKRRRRTRTPATPRREAEDCCRLLPGLTRASAPGGESFCKAGFSGKGLQPQSQKLSGREIPTFEVEKHCGGRYPQCPRLEAFRQE